MDSLSARTASQADDAASSEFDQQLRRLVLQRLKGADRSAELLTRADVFDCGISASSHCSGGRTRGQCHHHAACPLRRDARYLRAVRHDVVGEFHDTHVGAQVGALLRFDRQARPRCDPRTIVRRHPAVRAGNRICCAATIPNTDPDDPLSRQRVPFGDRLDVAVLGQYDDRRRARGQIGQQRLGRRIGEIRHCARRHRAQQRTRQQRRGGRLDHAGHVGQGAVLATDMARQVHGVKAAIDEFRPPGGYFAGRDRSNSHESCRWAHAGQRNGSRRRRAAPARR